MGALLANRGEGLLESTLSWWQLAGVDVVVDDAPRNWLLPIARPVPIAPADHAPALDQAVSNDIPETLEALTAWLSDPANLPELGPDRLAASGSTASGIMVLTDMPDPDEPRLAKLLDGMLSAIGQNRESVYLAHLAPARPPGGILDSRTEAELASIARRHVALAAPRMLLLMGDATTRALIGTGFAQARGKAHQLNLDGRDIVAIATFHPRFLIKQPARKADAWKDLRLMLETFES